MHASIASRPAACHNTSHGRVDLPVYSYMFDVFAPSRARSDFIYTTLSTHCAKLFLITARLHSADGGAIDTPKPSLSGMAERRQWDASDPACCNCQWHVGRRVTHHVECAHSPCLLFRFRSSHLMYHCCADDADLLDLFGAIRVAPCITDSFIGFRRNVYMDQWQIITGYNDYNQILDSHDRERLLVISVRGSISISLSHLQIVLCRLQSNLSLAIFLVGLLMKVVFNTSVIRVKRVHSY